MTENIAVRIKVQMIHFATKIFLMNMKIYNSSSSIGAFPLWMLAITLLTAMLNI